MMTVRAARDRIDMMQPGDAMCYHVGFLLADRARRADVDALADFMLRAGVENAYTFSDGGAPIDGLNLGHLTQKKTVPPGKYLYYFTKKAA